MDHGQHCVLAASDRILQRMASPDEIAGPVLVLALTDASRGETHVPRNDPAL